MPQSSILGAFVEENVKKVLEAAKHAPTAVADRANGKQLERAGRSPLRKTEADASTTTRTSGNCHAGVSSRKRRSNRHPQETKRKRPRTNSSSRSDLRGGSVQQRALSRSPLKRKNQQTERCEDCIERSRSQQLRKSEAHVERQPQPIGRSPQLRSGEARVEVKTWMGK